MNYRKLSFCNFVASGTNQIRRVKGKGARSIKILVFLQQYRSSISSFRELSQAIQSVTNERREKKEIDRVQ